jgi:hypothetical protein
MRHGATKSTSICGGYRIECNTIRFEDQTRYRVTGELRDGLLRADAYQFRRESSDAGDSRREGPPDKPTMREGV